MGLSAGTIPLTRRTGQRKSAAGIAPTSPRKRGEVKKVAARNAHHAIALSADVSAITHLRNNSKSILPPLRIRPTRLPRSFALS